MIISFLAVLAILFSTSVNAELEGIKSIRLKFPESPIQPVKSGFVTSNAVDFDKFKSLDYIKYAKSKSYCQHLEIFKDMIALQDFAWGPVNLEKARKIISQYFPKLRYKRCTSYSGGAVADSKVFFKYLVNTRAVLAVSEYIGGEEELAEVIYRVKSHYDRIAKYPEAIDLFLDPRYILPYYVSYYEVTLVSGLRKVEKLYVNYISPIKYYGNEKETLKYTSAALLEGVLTELSVGELAYVAYQMTKIMSTLWDNNLYYDTTLFKTNIRRCFVVVNYDSRNDYESKSNRKIELKGLLNEGCIREFKNEEERLSFDYTGLIKFLTDAISEDDEPSSSSAINHVKRSTEYPDDIDRKKFIPALATVLSPASTWHHAQIAPSDTSAASLLAYYNPRIQYLAKRKADYYSYCHPRFTEHPENIRLPPKHVLSLINRSNNLDTNETYKINNSRAFVIEFGYTAGINNTEIHSDILPSSIAPGIQVAEDIILHGSPSYYYATENDSFDVDSIYSLSEHISKDVSLSNHVTSLRYFIPSIIDTNKVYLGFGYKSEKLDFSNCLGKYLDNSKFSYLTFASIIRQLTTLSSKGLEIIPPIGFHLRPDGGLPNSGESKYANVDDELHQLKDSICLFPKITDGNIKIIPDHRITSPESIYISKEHPSLLIKEQYAHALGIILALTYVQHVTTSRNSGLPLLRSALLNNVSFDSTDFINIESLDINTAVDTIYSIFNNKNEAKFVSELIRANDYRSIVSSLWNPFITQRIDEETLSSFKKPSSYLRRPSSNYKGRSR